MMDAEILQKINEIDEALIEEASTFSVRKKKAWKKMLSIAASFLFFVVGLLGVFYYNNNKVKLDANGKIDIYSIKEAQAVETVPEPYYSISTDGCEPYLIEQFMKIIKEKTDESKVAVIYGTAENMKTVTVEEEIEGNEIVWCITTFDINVIDDLGTLDGKKNVHVVAASRYENGYVRDDFCCDWKPLLKNPTGLYLLINTTVEHGYALPDVWEINGKEYNITDFADYYYSVRFDSDGERFQYYYSSVKPLLDELRKQK